MSTEAAQRENLLLRELVAVYSHLSGLVAQNADVSAVVRLVARHTGAGVALLGRSLEVLAAAGGGDPERLRAVVGLPRVLAAIERNRRPLTLPGDGHDTMLVAPVVVGEEVSAYLVTITAPDGDTAGGPLLTEHAATICGIFLGRQWVVAAAAGRARLDLVEGLLLSRDREDGEAERWAQHLGFLRGRDHHVVAAAVPDDADPRVLASIEHLLGMRVPEAIVAAREHEVVAVVPVGLDDVRRLASGCADEVARQHPGTRLVVGLGGPCRMPAEIARSYEQARSAVDTTSRMGRAGVVAFEDLGIQRLLFQVPDLGELRAFAADVLGPLLGEAPLLATLTAWFEANGSPQRTARELHVHPNTVAYRIRRVEEITGMHLDQHRDRLMVAVACEIVSSVGGVA
ncbi:helix-turn-helix domain-containing protein [Pseudonocardia sp.]|uniref:PucR family transcriptional regulator n=1 Tax=Pseudonocardia sp. TaxID=60912 RepID=UPI002635AEFE|nr:helix-turn-helix domain-containing protein [Pseudonocardia sp.]